MKLAESILVLLVPLAAMILSSLRWLRVAQREHYVPPMTTKFAMRWWGLRDKPINSVAFILGFLVAELTIRPEFSKPLKLGLVVILSLIVVIFPLGLGLKGRTSRLEWTKRLKRLAGLSYLLAVILALFGLLISVAPLMVSITALCYPVLLDLATWLLAPYEDRSAKRFVQAAAAKLAKVSPRVVAVTGSFGKTTTKGYITALCSQSMMTVASPASFNNRAGLSRSINENLVASTELFVAEMGAYRIGEIAALVDWIKPEISVITAIGPVHLERFGSEEKILSAKSEILTGAKVAVLCVDYPKLAFLANELETMGTRVWRCSGSDFRAEICVKADEEGGLVVFHDQRRIGYLPSGELSAGNVACAVAVALELGVGEEVLAKQLFELKPPPHRLTATVVDSSGLVVLDDTYNSNPTGARHAMTSLAKRRAPGVRTVVVTPGMVELGHRQFIENFKLAEYAAEVATDLVIVGKTNKSALTKGALDRSKEPGAVLKKVVDVATRDDAVRWVRENLKAGDVVLYENDLPDHFP